MAQAENDVVQSYDEAVRWIYERIDYERIPPVRESPHFQLERVRRQLALIGSPQQRIPAIHIAGTKGKGSTAAMAAAMLRASDVRTGLFTSPHIERFEERMTVDGVQPSPEMLLELVQQLQSRLSSAEESLRRDPPTYFELATLLAWMYFDRCDVDRVVLETGLGGRLDCTNVCTPLVTVLTNVSLDHTSVLGETVQEIAFEKAGILKRGVPVVTGVTQAEVIELVRRRAEELEAPMYRLHRDIHVGAREFHRGGQTVDVETPWRTYRGLNLPLAGEHQGENAALAVSALSLLAESDARISRAAIERGLSGLSWPLRFQILPGKIPIIVDAAHNPAAIEAVMATLNNGCWTEHPRVLVFGASRDKDIHAMLCRLAPHFQHVVLTRGRQSGRSCSEQELQEIAIAAGCPQPMVLCATVDESIDQAGRLAGAGGLICATGSIFLAGEFAARVKEHSVGVSGTSVCPESSRTSSGS